MRFELTNPCGLAVFKTAPFDRSGTPPRTRCTRQRAAFVGEWGPSDPPSAARSRRTAHRALELRVLDLTEIVGRQVKIGWRDVLLDSVQLRRAGRVFIDQWLQPKPDREPRLGGNQLQPRHELSRDPETLASGLARRRGDVAGEGIVETWASVADLADEPTVDKPRTQSGRSAAVLKRVLEHLVCSNEHVHDS